MKVEEARECDVCKEALFIVRKNVEDDRVFALNKKDMKRHVCFSLPADANLLVMYD